MKIPEQRPLSETRPWGFFTILYDNENYKIKEIVVYPNQRLSYQSHEYRTETWTIITGVATVTMDDYTWDVPEQDIIWIPAKTKHRIANNGTIPLVFVEVQTGSYFGEDDIVRYQDDYNRVKI